METSVRYRGTVETSGEIRLDRYAAEQLRLLNRSQIKSRMLEARLNGKTVKLSRMVKTGDVLELSWLPAAPEYLEPENIPLSIIYEDSRCAVINKAQGMVVHPGAGNRGGTLANALLWRRQHRPDRLNQPDQYSRFSLRTGIVHRLDKDTSGVIIAAWDDEALAFLSAQFRARMVRKRYLALVEGRPAEKKGTIYTNIARNPQARQCFTALPLGGPGKPAFTSYEVIKSWDTHSLLILKPQTGRTHQLRVHLVYLGCPIAGDPVYGNRSAVSGFPDATLMLHARSLSLILPEQSSPSLFKAPIPERFTAAFKKLNGKNRPWNTNKGNSQWQFQK